VSTKLATEGAISHRFCLSSVIDSACYRSSNGPCIDSSHSSLNIRINYHPMNPLLSIASSNIADCFTKPLPPTAHRSLLAIGDIPTAPTISVVSATVDSTAAAPTVVASATPTVVASATTVTSDLVPTHPNLDLASLPIVLDTGASFPIAPAVSDYLSVSPAPSSKTTLSNDPYTLITGGDTDTTTSDLSSPDPTNSNLDSCFALLSVSELVSHLQSSHRLHSEVFGTATLTFVYSGFNTLVHIWVEPIDLDWIHWVPLPRLVSTESYFHLLGFDYTEVFAFLH